MQLGTLIASLECEDTANAALGALGELDLHARVVTMASSFEETPGQYVAASVGRFAASAGDEAWLGLIQAIERADDPGRAALKWMLGWALDEDTRSQTAPVNCGGGQCGCADGRLDRP